MQEQLTKQYFDEQFEFLARSVKEGFDRESEEHAEMRKDIAGLKTDVAGLKTDVADMKSRMKAVEDEMLTLSTNMVTKQYLDEKINQLIMIQYKDTLFKRRLLMALEEAKVLTAETRAKLEQLIPALNLNEK